MSNERNRKTQVKINLIKEYEIDSEDEEIISELDFESDNSSIYSLDDEIEEFFLALTNNLEEKLCRDWLSRQIFINDLIICD